MDDLTDNSCLNKLDEQEFSQDGKKKYYSITEVAQMLNVSASLIRFWEKKFPFIHTQKNKRGIRQYTSENITHLKRIHYLVKERGYTLEGARKEFKNSKKISNTDEVIATLKNVKTFLEKLVSELTLPN